LARAVVLVTSDHGEGLGEHGVRYHGVSGYEEVVRVPLVVLAPGLAAGEHEGLLSLHDVAPTVLGALRHAAPEVHGRSLLRLRAAPGAALHRFVTIDSARAAAGDEGEQPLRVVVEGHLKLVWSPADGLAELYDLAADPGERHDLAPLRPGDVERLYRATAAR
jgi:arylsulfatase A-like enzyme